MVRGTVENPTLPKLYIESFEVDTKKLTSSLFGVAGKTEALGKDMLKLERDNTDLQTENAELKKNFTEATDRVNHVSHELEKEIAKNRALEEALVKANRKGQDDAYRVKVSAATSSRFDLDNN